MQAMAGMDKGTSQEQCESQLAMSNTQQPQWHHDQLLVPSPSTHNNKYNNILSNAHSYKCVTFLYWVNNKNSFTTQHKMFCL
jgi:hypothetical protein